MENVILFTQEAVQDHISLIKSKIVLNAGGLAVAGRSEVGAKAAFRSDRCAIIEV